MTVTEQDLAEQPEDWTTPGAHPVVAGVHRIPLPLGSSALRAVNVYVVEGPDGPVLVDSGWPGADGGRTLEDGLRRLGHRSADIAHIVVTHAHHDHYTQALALRARSGTRVALGRGEAPSVEAMVRRDRDGSVAAEVPQAAMLRRAGAPELAAEFGRALAQRDAHDGTVWAAPDAWLDDGDVVGIGDRALDVRLTPGHTRGHVVLRDAAHGLLFAGDHVLPHITPSIGYERAPEPAPLRSYLDSLRLVRDLPDTVLLPAHGPVTGSVHTRVDELLVHHEERLDACRQQVHGGATTARAVAAALPWTRRRTPLERLETEHAALAVLEIVAHLDVLEAAGAVIAHEVDGVTHVAPG